MKQTAGRKGLGDLAPKFAELNDDVLFGEVWSRKSEHDVMPNRASPRMKLYFFFMCFCVWFRMKC